MKNVYTSFRLFAASVLLAVAGSSSAQFYEIANQLPALIQPALSGSLNYKGYVEAGFTGGVGDYQANVLSVSTSQGFRYNNWFFMGVGMGLDVMFDSSDVLYLVYPESFNSNYPRSKASKTGYFLPLFTDFRFNIGNTSGSMRPSVYIDMKIGATFMLNDDNFRIGSWDLSSRENFYLKPSLGVRIPINKNKPQQAFNLGFTYQLVTSNVYIFNAYDKDRATLNSLGATVGFEW